MRSHIPLSGLDGYRLGADAGAGRPARSWSPPCSGARRPRAASARSSPKAMPPPARSWSSWPSAGSRTALLERLLQPDGTYAWQDSGQAAADDDAFRALLDRRRRIDPDLWVVELDVASAERFAAEMNDGPVDSPLRPPRLWSRPVQGQCGATSSCGSGFSAGVSRRGVSARRAQRIGPDRADRRQISASRVSHDPAPAAAAPALAAMIEVVAALARRAGRRSRRRHDCRRGKRMPRPRRLLRIAGRAAGRPARRRRSDHQPRPLGPLRVDLVRRRPPALPILLRPPRRHPAAAARPRATGAPRSRSPASPPAGSADGGAPQALFFHARRVNPGWRLTRVATVGNHVFYR